MMKYNLNNTLKYARPLCVAFCSILFVQCADQIEDLPEVEEEVVVQPEAGNRPHAKPELLDKPFDWVSETYLAYSSYSRDTLLRTKPWEAGTSSAIPYNWMSFRSSSAPSGIKEYYSPENNWELIYSNLMIPSARQYFMLYNTRMGIMRMFNVNDSEYEDIKGYATYSPAFGLMMNGTTSMLNFAGGFAKAADSQAQKPLQLSTFYGNVFDSMFRSNMYWQTWEGIEYEFAYDSQSKATGFDMTAWWVKDIKRGDMGALAEDGTGGALQVFDPNGDLNSNVDYMMSSSTVEARLPSSYRNLTYDVGRVVRDFLKKRDPFFMTLSDKLIKETGVEDGFFENAIQKAVEYGGRESVDLLQGYATNIIAEDGFVKNISKIDFVHTADAKITVGNSVPLVDWEYCYNFPLPGQKNSAGAEPTYNQSLGSWNLAKTPVLTTEAFSHDFFDNRDRFIKGAYQFRYTIDCSEKDLQINPSIRSKVDIRNFSVKLVAEANNNNLFPEKDNHLATPRLAQPFGFASGMRFYSNDTTVVYGSIAETKASTYNAMKKLSEKKEPLGIFKAVVSFDMVDRGTGTVYSFSKWFDVQVGSQRIDYKKITWQSHDAFATYLQSVYANFYPDLKGYTIVKEEVIE